MIEFNWQAIAISCIGINVAMLALFFMMYFGLMAQYNISYKELKTENKEQKILLSDKFGEGLTLDRYRQIAEGYCKYRSAEIEIKHLRKEKRRLKLILENVKCKESK